MEDTSLLVKPSQAVSATDDAPIQVSLTASTSSNSDESPPRSTEEEEQKDSGKPQRPTSSETYSSSRVSSSLPGGSDGADEGGSGSLKGTMQNKADNGRKLKEDKVNPSAEGSSVFPTNQTTTKTTTNTDATTIMITQEQQKKKQEKLSELLAKAAPPKFSSSKEEPMVMPQEHFAKLFPPASSSLSPLEGHDDKIGLEFFSTEEQATDEDEEKSAVVSYDTASLVRQSLSHPSSSETWAQLIGLIAWDVLHRILTKASPTQIPSLLQRIVLLAWTGGPSYRGTALLPTTNTRQPKHQDQQQHQSFQQSIPRQPPSPLTAGSSNNYTPNIRGVANYGQTCFLNVVLHGLASLDSAMAYVEWIALEQDQKRHSEWHEYQQQQHHRGKEKPVPTVTVSELLLPLLHLINGQPGAIDPRELLWRIAQKNTQFQSNHRWTTSHNSHLGQQQDAQEVLQALLGMMVVDAQLEKGLEKASSYREQRARPLEASVLEEKKDDGTLSYGYDSDDEVLTVLSDRWSSPRSSTCSSVSGNSSVEEPQPHHGAAEAAGAGMWAVDDDSPNHHHHRDEDSTAMLWSGMKMVDSTGQISSYPKHHNQKEDRKATAKQPNLSSSVEDSMASSFLSTTSTIVTAPSMSSKQNNRHSASDDHRVSASMQIMLSTISSITPSPLCGWEGSVLQCQTCQHVRPIENSPFFMIPIVPTSMVMGHTGGVSKDSAPPPPCTLEQCLHYYTQMERVSDVECANCTLQKELQDWQEEVDLLQGAVQSVERKRKQQQKNAAAGSGSSEDQGDDALRMELEQAEWKVSQLKHQDPDNYELKPDEPFSPSKLLRSEALKCLILTRCPSVLCLHVQRRYYDPATDRMSKTLQHVIFEEVLDLAPFCAYGNEKAAAGFAGRGRGSSSSSTSRSPIHYRLTCVIEHKGNAFGGHYVCYRRLPSRLQNDPQNPKWYFCSDESIQPTTWQAVRQCQAYMLLYEAI